MKIYRKVIPRISKDVVRALLANRVIEVEDGHRDDAELDIAGVFVRYLNQLDKLTTDTQEALVRHDLTTAQFPVVREKLAKKRGIVMGRGALTHLLEQVVGALYDSKQVLEIFEEDKEIQDMLSPTVAKYAGVDEELDREIRQKLKSLREGTPEWESQYC